MKTVFIIGAGANVEIGMPSGIGLKDDIIKALEITSLGDPNKSNDISYAMQRTRRTIEQIENTASTIRKALPLSISIDNFIDMRRNEPDIALCSKLAIIYSILNAEKKCSLYKYLNDGYGDFLKSWYPLFFQKISENCDINEFKERLKSISFIIFNYDRCFEYYMIYAIKTAYGVSEVNAKNIIENMNIVHPYGRICDINKLPLGVEYNHIHLLSCATNIRTFTEDSDETKKERAIIKTFIEGTERIIFLGFAYHKVNLDLIFKDIYASNFVECYGTGYGISEEDRKYIEKILGEMDPRMRTRKITSDTCTQFFNNFWHKISF